MRKVGELSQLPGIAVRTLHHYGRIGLLRPVRRSEGGRRLYARDDVARLQQIIALRQLGFSLAEVAVMLNDPGFRPLAALQLRLERVELRIGIVAREELQGFLRGRNASRAC